MSTHPVPLVARRRSRRCRAGALAVLVAAVVGGLGAPPAGAADPATPEEWITLVYRTCLHRDPDPAGMEHWRSIWGQPDVEGGAQLTSRPVCSGSESLAPTVVDLYGWTLDRAPSQSDLAYWTPRVANGQNPRLVERHLLASTERYTASGATLATYVDDLYLRVLDRPASEGDRAYWVGRLGSGAHPARTVDALLNTPEARLVFVERLAAETVARPPGDRELDQTLYVLRTWRDPRLAVRTFLEEVALAVP